MLCIEPKGNGSKNTQEAKSYEDLAKDAWDYCSKSSKSIEVLYKNEDEDKKVLAKVHFRSCPSVSCIKYLHTYSTAT